MVMVYLAPRPVRVLELPLSGCEVELEPRPVGCKLLHAEEEFVTVYLGLEPAYGERIPSDEVAAIPFHPLLVALGCLPAAFQSLPAGA